MYVTLSPTPQPSLKEQTPLIFYTTMTTALGTVAALAWTDAIKSVFSATGIFPTGPEVGPWVVAVLATVLAIMGSRVLFQLSNYTLSRGESRMEVDP